jgi:hypothetical protein
VRQAVQAALPALLTAVVHLAARDLDPGIATVGPMRCTRPCIRVRAVIGGSARSMPHSPSTPALPPAGRSPLLPPHPSTTVIRRTRSHRPNPHWGRSIMTRPSRRHAPPASTVAGGAIGSRRATGRMGSSFAVPPPQTEPWCSTP